jgi:hypothetical protein
MGGKRACAHVSPPVGCTSAALYIRVIGHIRLIVLLALLLRVETWSQGDSVLLVYPLTPEQVQSFSTSDSLPSRFWSEDWGARDSLVMTCTDNENTYWGTCPPELGSGLTAKAATGPAGLYLLVVIADQHPLCRPDTSASPSLHDGLWVMCDTLSTADMVERMEYLQWYMGAAMTRSSSQLTVMVNSACAPERYVTYSQWPLGYLQFSGSAERLALDTMLRGVEVFIPWQQFGTGLCDTLRAGRRLAFTLIYFDSHPYSDTACQIAWRTANPMDGLYDSAVSVQKIRSWGELELTQTVVAPACQASVWAPAHRPLSVRDMALRGLRDAVLYDLRGRTLPPGAHTRGRGIVLVRSPSSAAAHPVW